MTDAVRVFSLFESIQGESTLAGRPAAFVRLAGCPLSCSYCDTREAGRAAGEPRSIRELVDWVRGTGRALVLVTGGEPLHQAGTPLLLSALADLGVTVQLETSGAFPIGGLDPRVRVVMDWKSPGSGMDGRMLAANLPLLRPGRDELKIVVVSRSDFDWALGELAVRGPRPGVEVLVSPASGRVAPEELAGWILGARPGLRLGLQLHKIVWPDAAGER